MLTTYKIQLIDPKTVLTGTRPTGWCSHDAFPTRHCCHCHLVLTPWVKGFQKGDQEIRESVKCHRSPPGDDFNSVETMFDRFKPESWIPKLMCQIKKYFTSSDPHHGISRQILWQFMTYILTYILTFYLTFYLTSILTFYLPFFLAFYLLYLRRFFVVEVRLGTLWSWACCSGPAGNTAI